MNRHRRRSIHGIVAACMSLVPAVWVFVLLATASSDDEGVVAFASSMIVGTLIVVPVVALAVVALSVTALIVNGWLGRSFAIAAIVLLGVQAVLGADLLTALSV